MSACVCACVFACTVQRRHDDDIVIKVCMRLHVLNCII